VKNNPSRKRPPNAYDKFYDEFTERDWTIAVRRIEPAEDEGAFLRVYALRGNYEFYGDAVSDVSNLPGTIDGLRAAMERA
jgi:hypothetical protein